jgi:hypothetical protein
MCKITRREAIILTVSLTTTNELCNVFKVKGDGSLVKCRMYDLEPGDLFETDGENSYKGIVKDRPFKTNGVWGVVSNERS